MAKRTFKTTRKVVGDRSNYRAWKEWAVGDWVIGKYTGKKKDQYGKWNRIILVEDAEFKKKGEAAKIIGKSLGLNANGMLDVAFDGSDERGIDPIEVGSYVKVTYNGMAKMEKGKYKGKDAHAVEVEEVEPDDVDEDEIDDEEEEEEFDDEFPDEEEDEEEEEED